MSNQVLFSLLLHAVNAFNTIFEHLKAVKALGGIYITGQQCIFFTNTFWNSILFTSWGPGSWRFEARPWSRTFRSRGSCRRCSSGWSCSSPTSCPSLSGHRPGVCPTPCLVDSNPRRHPRLFRAKKSQILRKYLSICSPNTVRKSSPVTVTLQSA